MMIRYVEGGDEISRRLTAIQERTKQAVIEAVEKTAVRMANHAKSGHEHGSSPHSRNRYENQTSNLSNSIFPSGGHDMQWESLSGNEIVGLFGVLPSATSVMEYAAKVEAQFPFVWPAAIAFKDRFVKEVATLVKFAQAEGRGF